MTLQFGWVVLMSVVASRVDSEAASPLPATNGVDPVRVCADLCDAGLAGIPCEGLCTSRRQFPVQSKSVVDEVTDIVGPRRGVCPTLCPYGLGEPLCACDLDPTSTVPPVDWYRVCDVFLEDKLPGCPDVSRSHGENGTPDTGLGKDSDARQVGGPGEKTFVLESLGQISKTLKGTVGTLGGKLKGKAGKAEETQIHDTLKSVAEGQISKTLNGISGPRGEKLMGKEGEGEASQIHDTLKSMAEGQISKALNGISGPPGEKLIGKEGEADATLSRIHDTLKRMAEGLEAFAIHHEEVEAETTTGVKIEERGNGNKVVDTGTKVADVLDDHHPVEDNDGKLGSKEQSLGPELRKGSSGDVDWAGWCKEQCGYGNGGLACNCDILP